MDLDITHQEITEGEKIDGDDYANVHVKSEDLQTLFTLLEGIHTQLSGKTIQIPVLIETKTLSAGTTTTTFSGLDGDLDGIYLLKSDDIDFVVPGGSDVHLDLKPNNISTNQYTESAWLRNGSVFGHTGNYLYILNSTYYQSFIGNFKVFINAKSGTNRLLHGDAVELSSGYFSKMSLAGKWLDTSTNITSLVIAASGGSFSGTISLYKIVEITL